MKSLMSHHRPESVCHLQSLRLVLVATRWGPCLTRGRAASGPRCRGNGLRSAGILAGGGDGEASGGHMPVPGGGPGSCGVIPGTVCSDALASPARPREHLGLDACCSPTILLGSVCGFSTV